MNAESDARLSWRDDADVELVDGYLLADNVGALVGAVNGVEVAVEGGFLHIAQRDCALVQIVSAPAVRRITYRRP